MQNRSNRKMIIGIPKEIKQAENRVGLTNSHVRQLVEQGHQVLVQSEAGKGSLIMDQDYKNVGGQIIPSIEEIYAKSDMIIKVKEPLPEEYPLLKENQILYTFLHLVAEPPLTEVLLKQKIKALAYETIQEENGNLPLLKPMSEVAGKLSTQIGASYLQKDHGGKGILLGGVPGVFQGHTVIIGGGTVGMNAADIAVGMGSKVTILDTNYSRMEYLNHYYKGRVQTLFSNKENIQEVIVSADLLIGAVLTAGSKAPKLITKSMISGMQEGSVIVDVSVDQGGCIESSHPTSHENPTFTYKGVIHYAVPNIPGIVARTSTYALTNVTFPYALQIANKGLEAALKQSTTLTRGLNTYYGKITHPSVARDLNLKYHPFP